MVPNRLAVVKATCWIGSGWLSLQYVPKPLLWWVTVMYLGCCFSPVDKICFKKGPSNGHLLLLNWGIFTFSRVRKAVWKNTPTDSIFVESQVFRNRQKQNQVLQLHSQSPQVVGGEKWYPTVGETLRSDVFRAETWQLGPQIHHHQDMRKKKTRNAGPAFFEIQKNISAGTYRVIKTINLMKSDVDWLFVCMRVCI